MVDLEGFMQISSTNKKILRIFTSRIRWMPSMAWGKVSKLIKNSVTSPFPKQWLQSSKRLDVVEHHGHYGSFNLFSLQESIVKAEIPACILWM